MHNPASRFAGDLAGRAHPLLQLAVALLIALSIPAWSNDHGDEDAATELLSDDNLLIVEIVLGNYRLAQDVFIYATLESTLVPLQPVFDALEFPIHVDPVAGKAHGWFLREKNRFDLNVESRTLTIGEQQQLLPPHSQLLSDGFDLYVDINQLNDWLPVTIELQTSRLRLAVTSQQPLPLELQLERDKARKQKLGRIGGRDLPVIKDHYALAGTPTIDVTMGGVVQEVADGSDASVDSDYSYSVLANADLLGMQGNLSLSRASSGDSMRERFTLYKKPNHPEEMMTGRLSAVAAGDIFAPPDALVFSGGEGLGADLQFGGVSNASDFDKRIIEGDAVPGWEVELYRNGALLDFQVVGDDGRYRFEDVAVDYGENVFDIRLFGPQGQEESRRQAVRIDDQARAPGQVYARLSHVDTDRQLFGDREVNEDQSLSVEKKSLALVQAGLSQSISLSAGFAQRRAREEIDADNDPGTAPDIVIEDQEFTLAGATISLPFASLNIQHVDLSEAGDAQLFAAQTRLGGTGISMSHKRYRDFRSDRNRRGDIDSESELRFSGSFAVAKQRSVSYQVIADYEEETNGNYAYSLENRAGFQLFRGRMTLDSTYTDSKLGDSSLGGRVRYLRVLGSKTSFRASADYTLKPEAELGGITANVVWRPGPKLRTQFGLDADFTGGKNNAAAFSASYLFDRLTLSADARLAESDNSSLMLTAEFSLAREGKKRWNISGQPRASFGRVRARTFLDRNNNGEFDEGDRPIEGVFFAGRSDWEERPTDANGVVYLDGFRASTPTNLKLDENSLEDPFWKNRFPHSSVISHAGALQHIDIPIVPTVEVEGSVLLETRDGERPLAGIPIHVTTADGESIASSLTEFDGFYILAGLPPGEYLLTIDPEALAKFSVPAFTPVAFAATSDEGIVYLPPILLSPSERAVVEEAPDDGKPDSADQPPVQVQPAATATPAAVTPATAPPLEPKDKPVESPIAKPLDDSEQTLIIIADATVPEQPPALRQSQEAPAEQTPAEDPTTTPIASVQDAQTPGERSSAPPDSQPAPLAVTPTSRWRHTALVAAGALGALLVILAVLWPSRPRKPP